MQRILIVLLAAVLMGGCSTRRYHYEGPDGRYLEIVITNSDTNIGELEVETADGTVVRLSQVSVTEKLSQALSLLAEIAREADVVP